MGKGRLEAFSDGVIAIILTIMVLELKVPHGVELSDLRDRLPIFASYIMSFVFIGIYWNNHHHLMHVVQKVSGSVLWANLHLLFWLSLIPFTTGWMGENGFPPWPVATYGLNLILTAVAYTILVRRLLATHGRNSMIAQAVGSDFKGYLSLALYALGLGLAFVHVGFALACDVIVSCIWLVPDRRIEKALKL